MEKTTLHVETERRTGAGRRETDQLLQDILDQLTELTRQPLGDSDGSELRRLLTQVEALERAGRLTVVCSWCKTVMQEGNQAITHSICSKCEAFFNAEADQPTNLMMHRARSIVNAARRDLGSELVDAAMTDLLLDNMEDITIEQAGQIIERLPAFEDALLQAKLDGEQRGDWA